VVSYVIPWGKLMGNSGRPADSGRGCRDSGQACRVREPFAPTPRRADGWSGPADPDIQAWIDGTRPGFPPARSSLIPMLQSAQTRLGYLPQEAMAAIGRHLGVSPATVEGVASFYAQFRFARPGRHRVTVCTGTACYVRGGGKLLKDLERDLDMAAGETSDDGAVSLEAVACFGACALAPVVVLDDEVQRQQTAESMKAVVAGIARGVPA
jgi:NADH-quinone oxidoreductase subunit E